MGALDSAAGFGLTRLREPMAQNEHAQRARVGVASQVEVEGVVMNMWLQLSRSCRCCSRCRRGCCCLLLMPGRAWLAAPLVWLPMPPSFWRPEAVRHPSVALNVHVPGTTWTATDGSGVKASGLERPKMKQMGVCLAAELQHCMHLTVVASSPRYEDGSARLLRLCLQYWYFHLCSAVNVPQQISAAVNETPETGHRSELQHHLPPCLGDGVIPTPLIHRLPYRYHLHAEQRPARNFCGGQLPVALELQLEL